MSFSVMPNGETRQLDLKLEQRHCLHLCHYWMHPVPGFMHGRLQTWFPFRIQMCLNGREWLSRQMDQAGMKYHREDNCFLSLDRGFRKSAGTDESAVTGRLASPAGPHCQGTEPDSG